jgi:hypothetical protein
MGKELYPYILQPGRLLLASTAPRRFLSVRWLARGNSGSFWFARHPSKNSDFGCNRCCKISMSQLT